MQPVLVLGMHRSGTSCLAGMLVGLGMQPPGPVVRNWDNRYGHHEATAAIRLNEDVLAHSGGSWIAPPTALTWDDDHAQRRDALLATEPPALIKDPRSLLTLPFWLASSSPLRYIGITRHPLAVARSLLGWRGLPLEQGLRLWLAHNQALHGLRMQDPDPPILDFDLPEVDFLGEAAVALSKLLDRRITAGDLEPWYHADQVHHDPADPPAEVEDLLTTCVELHRQLISASSSTGPTTSRHFPWALIDATIEHLIQGDHDAALQAATKAMAATDDPAAVLAPLVARGLRHQGAGLLVRIVAASPMLPVAAAGLALGKAWLESGRPDLAVVDLRRACAVADPGYEARHLLAVALRRAGDKGIAAEHLQSLLPVAIHPHQVWSTLGEWAAEDGDRPRALACLEQAINLAPTHRRGRLRSRRADLLAGAGRLPEALVEVRTAIREDPAWGRAAKQLAAWSSDSPTAPVYR